MLSVLFQESIFWPKTWSMRYWITSSNFTISRTETTCLHCLCKFPTSQSQELEVWESLNSIIQYFYCILAKIGNFTEKNKQTNNKKSSWAFNNYRYAGLVVLWLHISAINFKTTDTEFSISSEAQWWCFLCIIFCLFLNRSKLFLFFWILLCIEKKKILSLRCPY